MAFKKPSAHSPVPDSPDRLFRDLPRRKHASLYDHQGQMLRTYVAKGLKAPDVALQLPTGSGKTLVGLCSPNGVADDFVSALYIFARPGNSSIKSPRQRHRVPTPFRAHVSGPRRPVRYIGPRRPQQNGKVERSHRIDDEEFWGHYGGQDFDAAHEARAAWEYRSNHERFSMALRGSTPMEKLAALLAAPLAMTRSPDSVQ